MSTKPAPKAGRRAQTAAVDPLAPPVVVQAAAPPAASWLSDDDDDPPPPPPAAAPAAPAPASPPVPQPSVPQPSVPQPSVPQPAPELPPVAPRVTEPPKVAPKTGRRGTAAPVAAPQAAPPPATPPTPTPAPTPAPAAATPAAATPAAVVQVAVKPEQSAPAIPATPTVTSVPAAPRAESPKPQDTSTPTPTPLTAAERAALKAQLEDEIASLRGEEQGVLARCSALLSAPPVVGLTETADYDRLIARRGEAHRALLENAEASRLAVQAVRERHSAELARGRVPSRAGDEELRGLLSEADALQTEVTALRAAQADRLAVGSDAVVDHGAMLAALVGDSFKEWRGGVGSAVLALLRGYVRDASADTTRAARQREREQRAERQDALAAHRAGREERFRAFRTQRREMRSHAADAFYAGLRQRHEERRREATEENHRWRQERESEAVGAAAAARTEARAAIEAAVAQRQESLKEDHAQAERRLQQTVSQQAAELRHQRALHASAAEALEQQGAAADLAAADATTLRSTAVAEAKAMCGVLRGKVSDIQQSAVVTLRGMGARGDPRTAAPLLERQAALELARSQLAAAGECLDRDWDRLRSLMARTDTAVSQLGDKAAAARADTAGAARKVDAIRVQWERDERARLSRSEVPSADGVQVQVMRTVAGQLHDVVKELGQFARVRQERAATASAADEVLEARHAAATSAVSRVLQQFEELAHATASLEAKQRNLESEAHGQHMARAGLESDWVDFHQSTQRLGAWSQALRLESEEVAVERAQQDALLRTAEQTQRQLARCLSRAPPAAGPSLAPVPLHRGLALRGDPFDGGHGAAPRASHPDVSAATQEPQHATRLTEGVSDFSALLPLSSEPSEVRVSGTQSLTTPSAETHSTAV